jgi:hypothetical protein
MWLLITSLFHFTFLKLVKFNEKPDFCTLLFMCLVLDLSLLVSTFFLVLFLLWLPVELHVKLGPDLVPSFCVLSPKFQFYHRFLFSCPLGSRH